MANDVRAETQAAPTATPTKTITHFTCYDNLICAWWFVLILLLLALPLAGLIAPTVFTPGMKTTVALISGFVIVVVWKWDFRKIEMAVAGLLVPGLAVLLVYVAATNVEWLTWIPSSIDALSANDSTLLVAAGLLTFLMLITMLRDRMANTWKIEGTDLVNTASGKRVSVSSVTKTPTGYSVSNYTAQSGWGDYMEAIVTLFRTGVVSVGDHEFGRVFRAKAVADAINQAAAAAVQK